MTEEYSLPLWIEITTVIVVGALALSAGILIVIWLTEPIDMTEEERKDEYK